MGFIPGLYLSAIHRYSAPLSSLLSAIHRHSVPLSSLLSTIHRHYAMPFTSTAWVSSPDCTSLPSTGQHEPSTTRCASGAFPDSTTTAHGWCVILLGAPAIVPCLLIPSHPLANPLISPISFQNNCVGENNLRFFLLFLFA
ncbi:unnamed protein product [Closterium sp. NIES-54]